MGEDFKERAVHNINKKKFDEGFERIFGTKKEPKLAPTAVRCSACGKVKELVLNKDDKSITTYCLDCDAVVVWEKLKS